MFGNNNMQELMAKMQEMQVAVEDSKKKLETIFVKGESDDQRVRFIMNGNRVVSDVRIDESLLGPEHKVALERMLEQAFNKAIENANSVNEGEMKNTAAGMLPGLGI
jgi:DNA-binding YbaB/EbfC family protein